MTLLPPPSPQANPGSSWTAASSTAAREDSADLHIDVQPAEGSIEGGGSVQLRLLLRGDSCGLLEKTIRIACEPHGKTIELPIELFVVGPQLILRTRCLNFGLLPLGEAKTEKLVG